MDRQPRAVLAQCTSQGLIAKSEIPLPPGCTYAVCDPQGKVCYFVDKEGLQQFDLTTKRHSTLPYPKEFTSTRKVSGMAFDSKRRRLLVANAQRSGSIHALDLATKEWTAVGNVENWGMHGLAYEPDTDVFYGIGFNLRGRTGLLMTMSPEGAILRSVHVDLNLRDVIRDASLVQLAVVDDHVVVIVTGNAAGFRSDPGQGRIDIVDPRTGKRKFSGALEPKAAEK